MDKIMSIPEACLELYGEKTKSRMTTMARMCTDGRIKNCEKVGKRWFINATKEWPELFDKIGPESVLEQEAPKGPRHVQAINANTTVSELMQMLAQAAG